MAAVSHGHHSSSLRVSWHTRSIGRSCWRKAPAGLPIALCTYSSLARWHEPNTEPAATSQSEEKNLGLQTKAHNTVACMHNICVLQH